MYQGRMTPILETREIPGWEGFYKATPCGQIITCLRYVKSKNNSLRSVRPVLLKQAITNMGYRKATFCKNGVISTVLIHRMIALAWIPNPEGKPEVNHKDGDKVNNHYTNLEWATRSENEMHAYRVLGRKTKPNRKITFEQAEKIRAEYSLGFTTQKEIGLRYGMSDSLICNIVKRKTYKTP